MVQFKDKICIYCKTPLNKKNRSREHVFPKAIFKGLPNYAPIIVPSCKTCNNQFKKEDEYFRTFVSMPNQMTNPAGHSLFHNVVKPSLKHPNARNFRRNILSNIGKVLVPDKNGKYGYQTKFDGDRIDAVLMKIIRGLYYHHYKILLKEKNPFQLFEGFYYVERHDFFNSSEGKDFLGYTTHYDISKNNVFYRHAFIDNNIKHSVWYLWFFGSIDFFFEVKI